MDLVIAGNDDKLVAAFPTGASQFEPSGVRVMRFNLAGEHWLDPATLRLAFKLRNASTTHDLTLASGPWSLFSQVRLLMGGVVVEQIDYYNRQHELFRNLLMPNS